MNHIPIRSQIIMKKHIPQLAEIYNLLDQDHNQRNIIPVHNTAAFNVSAPAQIQASVNATYNNSKPQKIICSHCGYTGHTIDKCYKIQIPVSTNVVVDSSLWHNRLGHPYVDRTDIVTDVLGLKQRNKRPFHCAICPLAKNKSVFLLFPRIISVIQF